jgi:O-antigen ligase
VTYQLRGAVVPVYLVLCVLLGGASAAGFFANMLLQLMALPIIAWALLERRATPMPRASRQLLVLLALMIIVVGVQLVPLPPSVWASLPGRARIAAGYELLGMPLPWLPISVAPHETIASAMWLLPAIAVLLGMVRLGAFRTTLLALALIGVTIVAIALGAIQRAGNMAAYIYDITNVGMATGFFSNGNHMATLLMTAIPFTAALYLGERAKSRSTQRSSGLLVMLAGTLGVLVVGIAINGSLAGLGLTIPVIAATALMLLSRRRKLPLWSPLAVVALAAAGIALTFSTPLGNNLTTEEARSVPFSRYTSFTKTIEAATDFAPTGSGVGTFKTIYPMYEDPDTLTTTYVNHAHNDYLEIALEAGIPGLALLALFLLWWARRALAVWRSEEVDQFARAATIASAAMLAHSIVDYPLRTAAMSAAFAVCCALMAEARPWVRQSERRSQREARHLSAD